MRLKPGLWKKCPRCGRLGEVTGPGPHGLYTITWQGPPRNPYGAPVDEEACVVLLDLFNPQLGCGYDLSPRRGTGAWQEEDGALGWHARRTRPRGGL